MRANNNNQAYWDRTIWISYILPFETWNGPKVDTQVRLSRTFARTHTSAPTHSAK